MRVEDEIIGKKRKTNEQKKKKEKVKTNKMEKEREKKQNRGVAIFFIFFLFFILSKAFEKSSKKFQNGNFFNKFLDPKFTWRVRATVVIKKWVFPAL